MEVIHFNDYNGAQIDRRANIANGIKDNENGSTFYTSDAFVYGKTIIDSNLKLVVKITTDVKLNMLTREG